VRQDGVWTAVEGVVAEPAYPPADGAPGYQTFEFRFPPARGDALRIRGEPGGVGGYDFITIGELRAVAEPLAPAPGPSNVVVTLTATDAAGASGAATALVSLDNTPPSPHIVSPAQFATYPTGEATFYQLQQASLDAELPGGLACAWQVILHHDEHTHPGPLLEECAPPAQLVAPEGCGGGPLYFNEVRLTVTDPLGLSATASHWLVPECDRNLNGVEDALDISGGASLDADRDGVPDEAQADCDGNGLADLHELFFQTARDRDGDGVLDACDPVSLEALPKDGVGPPQAPPF
jgi:hypothetical protein